MVVFVEECRGPGCERDVDMTRECRCLFAELR